MCGGNLNTHDKVHHRVLWVIVLGHHYIRVCAKLRWNCDRRLYCGIVLCKAAWRHSNPRLSAPTQGQAAQRFSQL